MSDLLDVRQAAELLGVSPDTIYGWRHRSYLRPPGFPEGFRVGGRVRWHRRDLELWIERQRSGQGNGRQQR